MIKKMTEHYCYICKKVADHNGVNHRCDFCGLNHKTPQKSHTDIDFNRLKLTFNVEVIDHDGYCSDHDGYCSDPGKEIILKCPNKIYHVEVPLSLRIYKTDVPLIHYELRKYHHLESRCSNYCGLGKKYKLIKAEIVKSKVVDSLHIHDNKFVEINKSNICVCRVCCAVNTPSDKKQYKMTKILIVSAIILVVSSISALVRPKSMAPPRRVHQIV